MQNLELPQFRHPIGTHGNRGDIAPDAEKKKIIALGCSHTHGHTEIDETWPAILQKKLDAQKYQVLNMGRRNYGFRLNVEWYTQFARKVGPVACVVQVPLFCRQPYPTLQKDDLINYTMTNGSLKALKKGKVTKFQWAIAAEEMIGLDVERFREFLKILRSDKVRPIVVLYVAGPFKKFSFLRRLVFRHHKEIRKLCRSERIEVIGGKHMTVERFRKQGMLMDRTHPNVKGNRYIAELVYDQLTSCSDF